MVSEQVAARVAGEGLAAVWVRKCLGIEAYS
jgi:hypothetical protein